MATYDRSRPTLDSSLALWRYRRERAEISHHYWVATLAGDLLSYTLAGSDDSQDPKTALEIKDGRYDFRLGHDVAELRRRMKTAARWRRLSTLTLMTSAFEKFILGISAAAVDSDPTRTAGFPKKVDGLLLKKYGLRIDRPSLESLIKGEWSSRLAAYERLFGYLPLVLKGSAPELERIRQTRNRVAHHFGISDSGLSEQANLVLSARRSDVMESNKVHVSHGTILKWLELMGRAAEAIDLHLTKDHIGGYESAAIYLEWRNDPEHFEKLVGIQLAGHAKAREIRFGKMLSALIDKPLGYQYQQSIAHYVDQL